MITQAVDKGSIFFTKILHTETKKGLTIKSSPLCLIS